MKKYLSAAMWAAMLLSLTACDSKSDDSRSFTITQSVFNLYTDIDGADGGTALLGKYNYTMQYPENTVSFSVSSMPVPGGGSADFSTLPLPISAATVNVDGSTKEILSFKADKAGATGLPVTNLSGYLSQAACPPGDVTVPGYSWLIPGGYGHYPILEYNLAGKWRVRTFWPDVTFRGTTVTTYPNMEGPFETSSISYRVVMQMDASNALTGKADVIFYKAKFAPAAPELTVVLKDLALTFTKNGYTVEGTSVVPSMIEDGALQPIPRFTFDSFKFSVSGNLTTGAGQYKVAGIYDGTFQGTSMVWK